MVPPQEFNMSPVGPADQRRDKVTKLNSCNPLTSLVNRFSTVLDNVVGWAAGRLDVGRLGRRETGRLAAGCRVTGCQVTGWPGYRVPGHWVAGFRGPGRWVAGLLTVAHCEGDHHVFAD